jgi:Raf kinase inhibitor-like YbhB/YbcL family protein
MRLTSPAFSPENPIPRRFTCEGENVNPELSWQDAPPAAKAFVLIVHDPDAPRAGGYTHWVLYNLPAQANRIPENLPRQETVPGFGLQGKNDAGKIGYTGPCPPSGQHRYFFRLSALDREISIAPGATLKEVAEAMSKHVIDRAELMGTYARQSEQAARQQQTSTTLQSQKSELQGERSPELRGEERAQLDELGSDPGQVGSASAGQSGDTQRLSNNADMNEESVAELAETEQSLESAAVSGVEDAADHPERPVHTHNEYGRPDDVPPKRDRDEAA